VENKKHTTTELNTTSSKHNHLSPWRVHPGARPSGFGSLEEPLIDIHCLMPHLKTQLCYDVR